MFPWECDEESYTCRCWCAPVGVSSIVLTYLLGGILTWGTIEKVRFRRSRVPAVELTEVIGATLIIPILADATWPLTKISRLELFLFLVEEDSIPGGVFVSAPRHHSHSGTPYYLR
jgi:hypothetical protein